MSEKRQLVLAAGLIAIACAAAFAPAFQAGITNWDDPTYLAAAAHPERAFDTFVMGNYHPLTILSLAIGRNPAALHAVNVALHVIASILVLVFLWQLTENVLGAAAGALLWAVHPLRVESVAWIAERKGLLCGVFFVAALVAYMVHVRGRRGALAAAFALFVVALLSKVTAIAFPFVIVAIDWLMARRGWREKIAFFATDALFAAIAIAGQRSAVLSDVPALHFALWQRLLLACRALVLYLQRIVVPVNLSAFYPWPHAIGTAEWMAAAMVIALIVVTLATLRWSRAGVFALVFFLVTIGAALPLVATGWTLVADRFTYLPSIAFAYLVALAVHRIPRIAIVAALLAIIFVIASNARTRVWHDSISLWTSVIDYTDQSRLAFNSRAVALAEIGRTADARRDFGRALAVDPCYGQALRNRAILSVREGNLAAADADLAHLVACDPSNAEARRMRATLREHLAPKAR